jgi:nucleoid-associated protein YgaU
MSRSHACARALLLLVGALSAASLLARLGSALPLPDGLSRVQLDAWVRAEGAAGASFAVLRGVGLALALYSAAVAALALLAALTASARAARVALRVAAPSLRPLVAPVVALGLTVASPLPAGADARDQPPPVMQIVPSPAVDVPVMRLASPPVATPARPATHTVLPGDTFWSIAEDALRTNAPTTTDDDVVSYWRALIDLNRDRLRVPGEPDLIFPGQVFDLPPIS